MTACTVGATASGQLYMTCTCVRLMPCRACTTAGHVVLLTRTMLSRQLKLSGWCIFERVTASSAAFDWDLLVHYYKHPPANGLGSTNDCNVCNARKLLEAAAC